MVHMNGPLKAHCKATYKCLKRHLSALGLKQNRVVKLTGRQFQAHLAMDGKYAPTTPKVLTRLVHLMPFHSALTGTTPLSGDLWLLSGGGKWQTSFELNIRNPYIF